MVSFCLSCGLPVPLVSQELPLFHTDSTGFYPKSLELRRNQTRGDDEVDLNKVRMADYIHHLGNFFQNNWIAISYYLSISSDFIKRTWQSTLKSSYFFRAMLSQWMGCVGWIAVLLAVCPNSFLSVFLCTTTCQEPEKFMMHTQHCFIPNK